MTVALIKPIDAPLHGVIKVPGDKSVSHRRALLSLLCHEPVHLENFGPGKDCRATLDCIERLGKTVKVSGADVTISGEMNAREAELDAANSGTTARLAMGLLAGMPGKWTIYGDASLSRRPMQRIITPLSQMGAVIRAREGRFPPLEIEGRRLRPIGKTAGPPVERLRSGTEGLLNRHHGLVAGLAPLGGRQGGDQILLVTGFESAQRGLGVELALGRARQPRRAGCPLALRRLVGQ